MAFGLNLSDLAFLARAIPSGGGGDADGITTGLVGFWKMNEGSGSLVTDASGNGLDGTNSGADWTTGRFGGALNFVSANDDYVEIANDTLLGITTNWTISCWVNLTSIPTGGNSAFFVGKDEASGRSYAFGLIGTGSGVAKLNVQVNGLNYTVSTTNIADLLGAWHYVAVSYDGTTLEYFLDGVSDGSSSETFSTNVTTTPLRLGARGYAGFHEGMDGKLDHVKIFNRVLSIVEHAAEAAL